MSEPISEKEKISILLQEYNSLRQEIVNRTTHGFQLIAVGAALFIFIIQASSKWRFWVGLTAAIVALISAGWVTLGNLNKVAKRLTELEREINSRAGEKLLVWETEHGGGMWQITKLWLRTHLRTKANSGKPQSQSGKSKP